MEIILLIVVASVVVLGGVIWGLRRMKTQGENAAHEQFPNAQRVISNANFYGQQSKGVMQVRGNGTLVITKTEIYFKQWVTNKELRIALDKITGLETPKSFLGKTNLMLLLQVNFENEAGNMDAAAWLVQDVEDVKAVIDKIMLINHPNT